MAGFASNVHATNLEDRYDLKRARSINVLDIYAIYNDLNYRSIVNFLVPGLLHKTFVARKAYKGIECPSDIRYDGFKGQVPPNSMCNYKFLVSAVASVVSWIQDAVILTDPTFSIGNEGWFDKEPFSFLQNPTIGCTILEESTRKCQNDCL